MVEIQQESKLGERRIGSMKLVVFFFFTMTAFTMKTRTTGTKRKIWTHTKSHFNKTSTLAPEYNRAHTLLQGWPECMSDWMNVMKDGPFKHPTHRQTELVLKMTNSHDESIGATALKVILAFTRPLNTDSLCFFPQEIKPTKTLQIQHIARECNLNILQTVTPFSFLHHTAKQDTQIYTAKSAETR